MQIQQMIEKKENRNCKIRQKIGIKYYIEPNSPSSELLKQLTKLNDPLSDKCWVDISKYC